MPLGASVSWSVLFFRVCLCLLLPQGHGQEVQPLPVAQERNLSHGSEKAFNIQDGFLEPRPRHPEGTGFVRVDQTKWHRTIQELIEATDAAIVKILKNDHFLPESVRRVFSV